MVDLDPNDEADVVEGGERGPSLLRQAGELVLELVLTLVKAAVLAFIIIYFVAQANVVHGQSMEPTLHGDQRLIVEKVSYHFVAPARGDVVVVQVNAESLALIKRVVGLPGETIQIRNNQVYVDDEPLAESYSSVLNMRNYGPLQLADDQFFVMGDNRNASSDSRTFGPVTAEQIVGRAWVSFWPMRDVGLVR